MTRCILMAVFLGTTAAMAVDHADPADAGRTAYETSLRVEQRAFDAALCSLNGRFKIAVERLHLDARERGDLDETLTARQLWQQISPLTTAVVFGSDAPLSGAIPIVLPPQPPGRAGVAQAFTNYVGKVLALAAQFNASASNLQARYLAGMDLLVKQRTKRGDLEGALRVRGLMAAAAQQGSPRLVLTDRPSEPERSSDSPVPGQYFAGAWRFTGPAVQFGTREFRDDGLIHEFRDDHTPFRQAPYRIVNSTTLVQTAYGWVNTFHAAPDGVITLEARNISNGEIVRLTGRRERGSEDRTKVCR